MTNDPQRSLRPGPEAWASARLKESQSPACSTRLIEIEKIIKVSNRFEDKNS